MRGRHSKALVAALTVFAFLGAATAIADAPPSLTIKDPSAVKYASAHLSGTVDPEGGPSSTFWHFDYREASLPEEEASWTQAGFDQEVPAETEGSPTGVTDVAEDFGGFKPGTEYLVRLVASNEDGANRVVSGSKALSTDAVAKPEAKEVEVSGVTTNSAHFKGVVNSGGSGEGEAAGSYRFQCTPGCPGLEGERSIPGSGSDQEVSDDATGLEPHTEYSVKLIVRNPQTDAEGAAVEVEADAPFTTGAIVPTAASGTNTPEGQGKVLLRGYVNPHKAELSDCEFLYGPSGSYGQSAPCEGDTGTAKEPIAVTAKLTGLPAGETLHFAVRATNSAGPGESEDATFATLQAPAPDQPCPNEAIREAQHSTYLPDCRAYEMVSPPEKNGGEIISSASSTQAAVSGNAVSFASLTGFGDVRGTGVSVLYLAKRTGATDSNGWSTHSLFPRLEPLSLQAAGFAKDTQYRGELAENLSAGVFRTLTDLNEDPVTENVADLYLRDDLLEPGAGSYQQLSACPGCSEPLIDPIGLYTPELAGASNDFGHVVFEAARNLTADAPPYPPFPLSFCNQNPFGAFFGCAPRVYDWDHGVLRLVSRIPPPSDLECEDSGPDPCQAAPRAIAGQSFTMKAFTTNTVSSDGSRIFFVVPNSGGEQGGALYMREDSTRTVRLNASERTVGEPGEERPAFFQTASRDGSRIFFTSEEQLTDTGGSGLYVYDASKPPADPHNLTLISESEPGSEGGNVQGVMGASDDGEYVYFLTNGQLLADQPRFTDPELHYGVFAWHDGDLRFVGSLGLNSVLLNGILGLNWNVNRNQSRVSAMGTHLMFSARTGKGLTGYDHGHACANAGCDELYLYEFNSDALRCLSCNPQGTPASAGATTTIEEGSSAATTLIRENRPIADNGRQVFFESGEALVAEDTNARTDAYEYDTATGAIHLLSSGTSPDGSHFLDASPDGKDVFISVADPLVGWDAGTRYDLYDVRVGGGFPEPLPTPAPCVGESCRGASPAAPPSASGGSASFVGPSSLRPCSPQRQRSKHRKHKHRRAHSRCAHRNQGGKK